MTNIVLPATLTADYRPDFTDGYIDPPYKVHVSFGDYEVVVLEPVRVADDYYNRDEDEEKVVQETVAKWLREKLA